MTTTNRVQSGLPTGGQFAPTHRAESDVELAVETPPAKLPIGTAVTRLSWVDGSPIENGHTLGPPQMTRDGDGSAPYEVYPVQSATGRGLAGWWTTDNLAVTENPAPPKWPIDAEGSPARRFREALTDDTVFYVEDTDVRDGVTELALRCPGGRYTVTITDGRYCVVEHPATGAADRVTAEDLCGDEAEGYREAARAVEDVRTCSCGADYYGEDETGYDADGNGDNRCPACAQKDVESWHDAYRAERRNAGPSLAQQHADGVHDDKPMPECTQCEDRLYRDF